MNIVKIRKNATKKIQVLLDQASKIVGSTETIQGVLDVIEPKNVFYFTQT